jgi:two-component system, cell cycle response regulator DivK
MAIKVLLVEDNQDNRNLMRFLLERNGYEVVTANNGKEALVVVRQQQPDVILMDLSMPEMNGWDAAAAMKADPTLAGIPIIAVTAHTLPGDRRKILGAGFDHYISKPLNVNMFDQIVAQSLIR